MTMTQKPKQSKQPKKTTPAPKAKPTIDLSANIFETGEDLEALSQITEADKKAADALWKSKASKKMKNLLDAEVIEEETK